MPPLETDVVVETEEEKNMVVVETEEEEEKNMVVVEFVVHGSGGDRGGDR